MTRLSITLFLTAAVIGLSQTTPPSTEAPKPAPAKPAVAAPATPKPIKVGNVVIQGSLRSRLEAWDWFTPDTGDPTYAFSGNLFRLSLSQSRESWDWQAEFAIPFLLGVPDNAIATGTQGGLGLGANYFTANDRNRNSVMLFAKQGFIRFKNLGGRPDHYLRLGRFEYMDGSELTPKNATLAAIKRDRINMRLIGHFGWTHVGRSFDGLHYSNTRKSGNFTFLGAVPTRGVFQTDGWGQTNTAFGYAAYTKPWGKGRHTAETRVLGLHYHDWRQVLKTDNRALAARRGDLSNIRVATYGGHSIHAFETKPATIDLMLWGAGQFGRWGQLDHKAHAIAVEGGVQPKFAKKLKPWFRAGFYEGSGDGNASDNKHGAFFQILPTPRPFARFPFFNMMNNQDFNSALILRPHAKWTISSEFHALRLANRNDLWYQGGGAFQPWSFGYIGRATNGARSLANLYDTQVDYRIKPQVTLTGYIGYANGRAVMKSIYPKGKNATFGYTEVSYRF